MTFFRKKSPFLRRKFLMTFLVIDRILSVFCLPLLSEILYIYIYILQSDYIYIHIYNYIYITYMTLFFTKTSISQKICSSHRFESLHSTTSPNIGGQKRI